MFSGRHPLCVYLYTYSCLSVREQVHLRAIALKEKARGVSAVGKEPTWVQIFQSYLQLQGNTTGNHDPEGILHSWTNRLTVTARDTQSGLQDISSAEELSII